MNPRITSMENLIASDPGGRNVFGLVVADQLRLAAQSLRLGRRVGIVSGFYIPQAGAGETDGPPGAKVVGDALRALGIEVDYITDRWNEPLFRALDIEPLLEPHDYVTRVQPTHLVAVERAGRGRDGRYRNMRGLDISATTVPLDELFLEAGRRGLTTIGIGDGGNEIGMGKVFAEALSTIDHGADIASTVATDFCIAAGVSNWGAYGLAGALSVLTGRDLLPSAEDCVKDIVRVVQSGGAVDGVTHRREATVDGLKLSASVRMLENIRRQITPSPLEKGESLLVGVLGYGETGRSASALLSKHGHRVRISDIGSLTLERGLVVDGVETGGHTLDFLQGCDLVVASPGVREDSPIRDELHRRGVPVMSELEMAFQLCPRDLIAVTGTIGKRTTVELLQSLFKCAGRTLTIGGNRGLPLSALLLDREDPPESPLTKGGKRGVTASDPIALAVSSFQLETVVHFRPHIAILLNIDEAHLDRHRSIAEYIRIKSRIFMNHRPDDILILPFDDERLRTLSRKHHGRTFFVSRKQAVDRGAWLADGAIWTNIDGTVERIGDAEACPSARYPYPENLLSAAIAARLCGLPAAV
ncbi:MAG: glutamate cyclase domain-containing protein [Planctomycetota bacterium]